jgi:hypothetical protein
MHRFIFAGIVSCLGLAATAASAAPATPPGLAPLPRTLPPRCQPVAQIPASARIPDPALGAHISVANCMAEVAMNALDVQPDAASIARFDAAVAPSLAMLDNVIRVGGPYWNVIAEDARRDLYVGMIVRERQSVTDAASREDLEARLGPWQDGAARSIDAIAALARSNPELARRNAVIGYVIEHLPAAEARTPRTAKISR